MSLTLKHDGGSADDVVLWCTGAIHSPSDISFLLLFCLTCFGIIEIYMIHRYHNLQCLRSFFSVMERMMDPQPAVHQISHFTVRLTGHCQFILTFVSSISLQRDGSTDWNRLSHMMEVTMTTLVRSAESHPSKTKLWLWSKRHNKRCRFDDIATWKYLSFQTQVVPYPIDMILSRGSWQCTRDQQV